jgi:putative transcriptional regulator
MRHPPSVWVSSRARNRCMSILLMAILLLAAVVGMVLAATAFAGQPLDFLPFRAPVGWNLTNQSAHQIQLAKGRFLVASSKLVYSQFSETVVLLLQYDRLGAIGLVINQPTEMKLAEILPEVEGLQQRSDMVYHGGPVAQGQLMLLIRTASPPEGSHHVLEDIYISSSQEVIRRMVEDPTAEERFRVYAGYAGWAPGQLDLEVSRGGWHILHADPETLFDKSPPEIWPELIRRSSAKWVRALWPVITWQRD